MLKKIIGFLCLSLIGFCFLAQAYDPFLASSNALISSSSGNTFSDIGNSNGFYVGVHGGYFHEDKHYHYTRGNVTEGHRRFPDQDTRFIGSFAGYGGLIGPRFYISRYYFGRYYVGGELGADMHRGEDKAYRSSVHINGLRAQARYPVYLDFRPGFSIFNDQALLYARLGAGYARYEMIRELSTFQDITDTKSALGVREGAGIEFFVFKHMTVRTEVVFTQYRQFIFYDNVYTHAGVFSHSDSTSFQPRNYNISLGMTYYF
ncbi:MAG: hypothetical protein A3C55_00195 [Gammaproteobacteria bacterium RIFCSPHIGHO2_02_FULL_42_13]|nr:MAG: hypothetical protein A3C55_00195 [Gammaproteobacteria bacterium RIFCSPHIGHO2_02_FULL_42_13]OGT68622.1 MAG: hypothetical protein A3H43_00605 [Gammaproteobacteria bacterium RIFCSPLOWO2_02_FULL_42_9]HLB57440.1 outer membrane beta-barrel protein [Gammaproteobacteria bacterium]